MRIVIFLLGIALAATGGVIAYRAYFIEPRAAIVITDTSVRELPDTFRVVAGILLMLAGSALAYFGALRRSSR